VSLDLFVFLCRLSLGLISALLSYYFYRTSNLPDRVTLLPSKLCQRFRRWVIGFTYRMLVRNGKQTTMSIATKVIAD